MIDKFKTTWLGRSRLEKILITALCVAMAALVTVFWAWQVELVPFARVYGTVADWCIFAATAGGFWVAAYTLRKNASDETKRHERLQRVEASRVTATLTKYVSGDPVHNPGYTSYRLAIRNGGSSPVSELTGFVDYTDIHGRHKTVPGERTVFEFSVGVAPAGLGKNETFQVSGKVTPEFTEALSRAICFQFRDAEGDVWICRNGKLRKIPPNRQDEMVTAVSQ